MKTFKIVYSAILVLLFILCMYMLHTTEINLLNAYYAGNEDLIPVYKDQQTALMYVAGLAAVLAFFTFTVKISK